MKYKDYYKILGVERGAPVEDIKKAYRKLARKYHPDVSKETNAKERFQEVSEAYETLKDGEKRAAYDSLGRYRPGQDFRPPPDWADRFGAHTDEDLGGIDLSDLFASLGAGLRGRRPGAGFAGASMPISGEDQEVSVQLSLEDAARGTEIAMEVTGREHLPDGRIVRRPRTIRARIPKGVTDGERMRLRGKGGPGVNGGPAGDLYLNIALRPHPLFKPNGHDLYLEVPVRDWEAALGAQVEIPTLEGRVTLRIPPGSRSGHQLRLSGKGLPQHQGGAGDLYAVLAIVVPAALSERERKLYEELRAVSASEPRAQFAK